MTIVFANGGGPTYPGVTFTTSTGLLTLLHNTLVSAGWLSITNTPSSNLVELAGFSGFNACYLRAYVSANQLVLRGGHTASFSAISPELLSYFTGSLANFSCQFTPGTTNYCWITADADCFCIMIRDSADTVSYGAQRFGFYDRHDTQDEFAWGLGPLYTFTYGQLVARSALTATNWYDAGAQNNSTNKTAPYFGEKDVAMPIEGYISVYTQANRCTGATDSSNINAGQRRHYGNSNGATGAPQLSLHYVLEGSSAAPHPSYSQNGFAGYSFFYRGTVKFAATGMAHLAPGSIATQNGKTYISPGPLGIGFQVA